MFKRILYEEWTNVVPILSFCFTFGVFLAITLRALFLKKDFVNQMGQLPLEEDSASQPETSNHE